MPLGPNGYNFKVLHPFRGVRFNNSIATNGRFWSGPLTNLAINSATYLFIYRFFADHTAEHPDGYLGVETLKSFYGVSGNPGSFKWAPGRERIPDNWHRRSDDYGLVPLALDIVDALKTIPYIIAVGGNTGKPNTFTGVNINDLTGGVYNAQNLLEGNDAMCFGFQAINAVAPDILEGLVGNVVLALSKMADALNPIFQALGCPQMAKYDPNLLQKFPGSGYNV